MRWLLAAWVGSLGCTSGGGGQGETDAATDTPTSTVPTTIEPSASASLSTSGTTATTEPSQTEGSSTAAADSSGSSSTGDTPVPDDCEQLEALLAALPAAADDAARRELVDEFIVEVQYGAFGFPLRCDEGLGFVVADAGTATVSVAGDFNDWDEAANPLAPAVEGFGFRYVLVDGPVDPGLYKLVFDGAVFEADPLARRYGWDEFGEYSLTAARPDASHHERWPSFGEGAGDLAARTLEVYVPRGAEQRAELPVLYMQDGQNLFSPDAVLGGWHASTTADALIEAGDAPPFLIVGIPNTPARFDEYTHVQDDFGGGAVGGRGDEYVAFLTDGIKPFIDERYPTDPGADATAVAGSSLGGLVSLYAGYLHPEVFGYAGSMSGTLDWGQFALGNATMQELYAGMAPDGLVVYVDSGGSGPCPNGGSDNYCANVDFAAELRALGWTDDVDLFYRHTPGAPHSEPAWAARLGEMLSVWFPGAG